MRYRHIGKLSIVLGTLLAVGLSSPAPAESRVDAQNDGHGITAYAHSSDDILSTSIRIVGPAGFVFEDRVEDSALDWAPERELSDGVYSWEVRMVTVEPGAPPREDPALYRTDNKETATTQGGADANSQNADVEGVSNAL